MRYDLTLDGKKLFTGTENECFIWVHKNTPYSFSLATKIGYKLEEVEEEEEKPNCEFCNDTGQYEFDEVDSSGNVARGTGSGKCMCQYHSQDID